MEAFLRPELANMLKTLTLKERDELFTELGRQQHREQPVKKGGQFTHKEELVWNAVYAAWRNNEFFIHKLIGTAVETCGRARFSNFCNIVYEVIDCGLPRGTMLKTPEIQYLLDRLMFSFAVYLKYKNYGTSFATAISNANNFREAVDRSYPGYLNAKLLTKLLPSTAP